MPEFSKEFFATLVKSIDPAKLPSDGFTPESLITTLTPILFDPSVDAKRVNLDSNVDLVKNSANNFYEGLTQKEVEDYYSKIIDKNNNTPISYGLNSKLIKENGKIVEKTWKVGGMYSGAIEKIVYWLEKAITVAETPQQQKALEILVDFYKTGDLKKFDDYNIAWVADTASRTDVVNGFIEVYGDALGYRASYESVVSIKDMEATKRIAAISKEAKWFEDNSPLMSNHKKPTVTGISAKVITVVVEAGDASPSTPIGINLPNANWIRRDHGSKSVNLGNIVYAYGQAAKGNGFMQEFAFDAKELEFEEKYGALGDNLHTDMHEVIGHASGQINPGVGQPAETLKNYASTLEEARADLVALYYMLDNKLVEIGVMPSLEVGKAQYNDYIRNGMMTQLVRLKPGDNIEESHMRNRQLIAQWVFEKGKAENVIEKVTKENKTYFVIRNYEKLRTLFGELLREVQRIKSEGDFKAGQSLVETYGVKVDPILHKEVLARYEKLKIAPYGGFLNPKLVAVEKDGKITDVKIEYPADFTEQMMFYGKEYAFLPVKN
jgi:dipeptidyl-peptidase-3